MSLSCQKGCQGQAITCNPPNANGLCHTNPPVKYDCVYMLVRDELVFEVSAYTKFSSVTVWSGPERNCLIPHVPTLPFLTDLKAQNSMKYMVFDESLNHVPSFDSQQPKHSQTLGRFYTSQSTISASECSFCALIYCTAYCGLLSVFHPLSLYTEPYFNRLLPRPSHISENLF